MKLFLAATTVTLAVATPQACSNVKCKIEHHSCFYTPGSHFGEAYSRDIPVCRDFDNEASRFEKNSRHTGGYGPSCKNLPQMWAGTLDHYNGERGVSVLTDAIVGMVSEDPNEFSGNSTITITVLAHNPALSPSHDAWFHTRLKCLVNLSIFLLSRNTRCALRWLLYCSGCIRLCLNIGCFNCS